MSMNRRVIVRFAVTGLGMLALLVQGRPAPAHEQDTHFLMTYVACRAAGFTQDEALTIAAVDQGMDDSPGVVANGGLGGSIPNTTEEWLWHALDRLGGMAASGVFLRKEHLFQVAKTRRSNPDKLLHLGVFFHYQQDTWAHRHHYLRSIADPNALGRFNPSLGTYDPNHLSKDGYVTYNTPFGHAFDYHQPDRPPFDPVASYLCLQETIDYAQRFLSEGYSRPANPLLNGFRPYDLTGVSQDDAWNDPRKNPYFHMLGGTGAQGGTQFLTALMKAQINAYRASVDLYYFGQRTADEADVDAVRLALQEVCTKYPLGLNVAPIPTLAEKESKGFMNLTSAGLVTDIPFAGRAGENSEATSTIGMQANESVNINGATDLSQVVKANNGACVYSIKLLSSPGLYDYVVSVDAQGPKGFTSGNMYLNFIDETGDVYALKVFDSSRRVHTVAYSSRKPGIVKIRWSNTGDLVTGRIP